MPPTFDAAALRDDDAWDDSALVRAYDDAIARHGGRATSSSSKKSPKRAGRRGAENSPSASPRETDERVEAGPAPVDDRPRGPPPPAYYYAETSSYGEEHHRRRRRPSPRGRRPRYRHHPPPPPPPPSYGYGAYDAYDAYDGYYARDGADDGYGGIEAAFESFSPFGRAPAAAAPGYHRSPPVSRSPRGPLRPPPDVTESVPGYHRSPPVSRSPRGPPRPPPDVTESARETATSYADDGYDPDELANLLLAWYYAGYYTGSFSRRGE